MICIRTGIMPIQEATTYSRKLTFCSQRKDIEKLTLANFDKIENILRACSGNFPTVSERA